VRQFTQSPIEQLFWATSSGTSMMPAILDSDILLIDTGQKTPRLWDHVWAIEMHGLGMIKVLRPGKEGAMRILSINPDYPEELAYDGEMNVIGRVVAIVRKI
jgi:phage repressor protein C with HTH and peptisase S24 domain